MIIDPLSKIERRLVALEKTSSSNVLLYRVIGFKWWRLTGAVFQVAAGGLDTLPYVQATDIQSQFVFTSSTCSVPMAAGNTNLMVFGIGLGQNVVNDTGLLVNGTTASMPLPDHMIDRDGIVLCVGEASSTLSLGLAWIEGSI